MISGSPVWAPLCGTYLTTTDWRNSLCGLFLFVVFDSVTMKTQIWLSHDVELMVPWGSTCRRAVQWYKPNGKSDDSDGAR